MLILTILAGVADAAAPAAARVEAGVRIVSPAVASEEQWERAARKQRRHIKVVDERGRQVTVLTIEFE